MVVSDIAALKTSVFLVQTAVCKTEEINHEYKIQGDMNFSGLCTRIVEMTACIFMLYFMLLHCLTSSYAGQSYLAGTKAVLRSLLVWLLTAAQQDTGMQFVFIKGSMYFSVQARSDQAPHSSL